MKGIFSRFSNTWNSLPPDKKRKTVLIAIALGIIVVSLLAYVVTRSGSKPVEKKEAAKKEEIKLDTGVLEKTQLAESQKQFEELKKELEALKEQKAKEEEARKKEEEKLKELRKTPPPPPPPPLPQRGEVTPPKPPEPPKPEVIGGIGMVSQEPKKKEDKEAAKEKDTKKKYYLPSSFMEATLLSGLDAPAVGKGEAHPVPVLLRVKAPAVLPNKVKTNLKGCFIIAEGLGNLATERADLRVVSLSCIDRKGNAVIDQKLKGFIVDSDGKIGLRGRVVSKMGSVLVRSFLAGLFSGLGQVAGTQAYSYTVTGSGTVSTLEPGKVGTAMLGGGIQQASQQLTQFYLELARQSIPVIEIGATRNVTVVISEGVELEVKTYDLKD
ncbi:MAG: TraB/VirB10 family protein [Dictyoglomus turgidum]